MHNYFVVAFECHLQSITYYTTIIEFSSATNAGLTVSIRNDKTSNGSLEAGALVLADQGM